MCNGCTGVSACCVFHPAGRAGGKIFVGQFYGYDALPGVERYIDFPGTDSQDESIEGK